MITLAFPVAAFAQPAMLKRTTTRTDKLSFGAGGTVAVIGAPNGSISIEGWQRNEVEIMATIELQAANETDLARLAEVTGFTTDESPARVSLITTGTHNKAAMKKVQKKFPKELMGLPFRVDYVIHVPKYCDIEIDGGKGDLSVTGIDGSMRINFLETSAKIELIGGGTTAVIGNGTVDIMIGVHTWRGRSVDVQLASGNMRVRLPSNLSADIDAVVLRNGNVENLFADLKPRERKVTFTDRSIIARAGAGGIPMKFAVGEGSLKLERLVLPL